MSATRDKSQKTTFVFSNLYQLYRKGKEAAEAGQPPESNPFAAEGDLASQSFAVPTPSGLTRAAVLKRTEVTAETLPKPEIRSYVPPELLRNRIAARERMAALSVLPAPSAQLSAAAHSSDAALEGLKQNIKALERPSCPAAFHAPGA